MSPVIMFPFVPTCDDEMSALTYLTFWALITGIGLGAGVLGWWIRREIRRIDTRIDTHAKFVSDTTATLATMSTDIAVTRVAVLNIEAALADLKKDISEIRRDH